MLLDRNGNEISSGNNIEEDILTTKPDGTIVVECGNNSLALVQNYQNYRQAMCCADAALGEWTHLNNEIAIKSISGTIINWSCLPSVQSTDWLYSYILCPGVFVADVNLSNKRALFFHSFGMQTTSTGCIRRASFYTPTICGHNTVIGNLIVGVGESGRIEPRMVDVFNTGTNWWQVHWCSNHAADHQDSCVLIKAMGTLIWYD